MELIIEVEKIGKDYEFTFLTLPISHSECYGGKISIKKSNQRDFLLSLSCERCNKQFEIRYQNSVTDIIKTAIDGNSRKINDSWNENDDGATINHEKFISVSRKPQL